MKTRRMATLVSALVAVCALLASTANAATATALPTSPPTGPPDWPILDTHAHPVLTWSVPDRYTASWAAWTIGTATYDNSFVNPKNWAVTLDACSSTSLYRITGYTFTITQQSAGNWSQTFNATSCNLPLPSILPGQGYYSVTLTLHTSIGPSTGVSAPTQQSILIHDYLIVSLGDSLASGEGNPDVAGTYDVDLDFTTHVRTPAQWQDPRCHRSAKSGPALAAKALEDADPHTSITFVDLACSGAEIANLINTPYGGITHVGATTERPQIDAAATAIAGTAATPSTLARPARTVDALELSIGINDLHFGDIIKRCASAPHTPGTDYTACVRSGGIATQLAGLTPSYRRLADAIAQKLPSKEVYISDYPSSIFVDGAGCDELGGLVHGVGIDNVIGSEMALWGDGLDSAINQAMRTFRGDVDRWNLVDLDIPFAPHGYCDNVSWFVKHMESLVHQGDEKGTAHPNAAGTQAYANILKNAVALDQVPTPYRHLIVTINAIKVPTVLGVTRPSSIGITMFEYQNDLNGVQKTFSIPRTGQWVPIPAGTATFSLDVYPSPSSPRHATGLYMSFAGVLGVQGTLSNSYNAGRHTVTHPHPTLLTAVDYTVTVQTPTTNDPAHP